MTCLGCNSWTHETSGGIAVGGSAVVTDSIVRGGVRGGGSALVDIAGDPFDGFSAVWFLDEDAGGVADEYEDSSANQLDGIGGNGEADNTPTQIEALACLPAQEFAGRHFIVVPAADTPVCSVSCWVRVDSFYEDRTILSRPGFRLGFTVLRQPYLVVTDGVDTDAVYSSVALVQERWCHVAATWQPGASLAIYVDGELVGTAETAVAELAEGSLAYIGRHGTGSYPSIGLMDLRLLPTVPCPEWWGVEHAGLCPGLVESVGEPEEPSYS